MSREYLIFVDDLDIEDEFWVTADSEEEAKEILFDEKLSVSEQLKVISMEVIEVQP